MTELEKLKKKAGGVLARDVTNGQWSEIQNLLDRAYALGKAERGVEKMVIEVHKMIGKHNRKDEFWWVTASYDLMDGDWMSNNYESREDAIGHARSFWSRFGVEIEVVP